MNGHKSGEELHTLGSMTRHPGQQEENPHVGQESNFREAKATFSSKGIYYFNIQ